MRRTDAARYARWSAGVAISLVAVTLGVYLQRAWVAHREKEKAPPPAPPMVEKQSTGLKFSKVDGERTIFEVKASRSTEFKGKDENLLEDVQITIFGNTGARHDTIHTTSCQYAKDSGAITCSGEVEMVLESAADAQRGQPEAGAAARAVRAETRGVRFDRASGIAKTDQQVRFSFPGGHGEAIGVQYSSDRGVLHLERDVQVRLRPALAASAGPSKMPAFGAEEVEVRGASLDYRRDTQTMRLAGPAEATTRSEKVTAGEFALILDAVYHAQRLVASAGSGGQRPEIRSQGPRGESVLVADTLAARFAPQGWVEAVEAAGAVEGSLRGAAEEDRFRAERMEMSLTPRVSKPRELTLEGNVSLHALYPKTGEARELETPKMHVVFTGGGEKEMSRPTRGETLAAGTVHWTERASANGTAPAQTKLSADHLALDFGANGLAERLEAAGNVQAERQIAGRPVQTATARNGAAQLVPSGGWSQMELQGDVRLKEGERNAQGEQATFYRAQQTAVLTGKTRVRDAATETQAQRITFYQASGEIRAEGAVRSSDLSPHSSTVHLAPRPANVSSEALTANSQTGRALYTGHARLWQGDSVLEADAIELLRNPRILNAKGNVRAVFPEAAFSLSAAAGGGGGAPGKKTNGQTGLWHVQAENLSYQDAEGRAHLEKNVLAVSGAEKIRAAALELYFSRSGENGAQQLSRAVGTGGVTVEQGDRRGSAERGEYTAAEGKFVLSGGTPTLYDAFRGTTTGRQLTFFLADDTIIVESENGSRTLTKHRVEK